MKKAMMLLLALIFAVTALSMTAAADEDVLWLQDSEKGPIFGIFQQDTEKVLFGDYAGKVSGGQVLYAGAASFAPVDVSGYEYVHINLYVEKAADVGSEYLYFEISSAGACDVMELEWRFEGTIVDGWNHLVAKVEDGAKYDPNGGEIDLTAINYTRTVIQTPAGAPVWIDGMFFSNSASNYSPDCNCGAETAVAVAVTAVAGAAALLFVCRKK